MNDHTDLIRRLHAITTRNRLTTVDVATVDEAAAALTQAAAPTQEPVARRLPTQEEIDAGPHAGITTPGDYAPPCAARAARSRHRRPDRRGISE